MEGILVSIDRAGKKGMVDTRNDRVGKIVIYFDEIPEAGQPD